MALSQPQIAALQTALKDQALSESADSLYDNFAYFVNQCIHIRKEIEIYYNRSNTMDNIENIPDSVDWQLEEIVPKYNKFVQWCVDDSNLTAYTNPAGFLVDGADRHMDHTVLNIRALVDYIGNLRVV